MLFFWIKKALARLVFPMPLSLFLVVAGLVLILFHRKGKSVPRKRRIAGSCCIAAGAVILLTGGYFGTMLLNCYAGDQMPLPVAGLEQSPPEGYLIAVTSAGYCNGDLNSKTSRRFREGYRLAREFEKKGIKWRMVLSFPGKNKMISDRVLCEYNRFFEVPAEKVFVAQGALNSRQEIEKFLRYPGRMIIVSSAGHLPRLLSLARLYGVKDPLSSSAERVDYEKFGGNFLVIFPAAAKFADFETLVYEVLGMLELKLTSLFSAPPALLPAVPQPELRSEPAV